MKIHQVVPHIHEEASGPSYSVPSLCEALARDASLNVTLHVLEPKPPRETKYDVISYPQWRFPRSAGVSPAMHQGLRLAAADADIMHGHSLWMMPNVYPAWATRGTNRRLVVAPRGTLEPWSLKHSRWRKKVAWTTLQRAAVAQASCLHVTASTELDAVRKLGLRQPVAILPNGVDIPSTAKTNRRDGRRRLLYLGRLHEKKGLKNLLRAWASVQDHFPEWELRIVGRDQGGHLASLQEVVRSMTLPRVTFVGPVYGAEKSREYQDADLFVLPTYSENFGMVVAEALAHGTPAICTKGAPWPALDQQACGWWIDTGVKPLVASLKHSLALPPSVLEKRGELGREWMKNCFGWQAIAAKSKRLYAWLLGGGDAPEFVDLYRPAKAA